MIKNYFRILKKPHAYLQTILKTPVKFQKDRTETVGGVKGTRYLLKTRNHAPRATHHAPRPTENQKQCPSTFLRKGGGQYIYNNIHIVTSILNFFSQMADADCRPLALDLFSGSFGRRNRLGTASSFSFFRNL